MMHFPLGPTDRTMNMTPWFHRGGIHSGGPCPTLYAGGEVVILRDFAPKRCLEYAAKYNISFLIGVPTIIAMLARTQERTPHDLSALRGIVTMGAPFEKSACEKYMKLLTPNIFNGYGTTESFWNTFLRPFDLPDNAGSAGRSCTDDEVRIVKLRRDGNFAICIAAVFQHQRLVLPCCRTDFFPGVRGHVEDVQVVFGSIHLARHLVAVSLQRGTGRSRGVDDPQVFHLALVGHYGHEMFRVGRPVSPYAPAFAVAQGIGIQYAVRNAIAEVLASVFRQLDFYNRTVLFLSLIHI